MKGAWKEEDHKASIRSLKSTFKVSECWLLLFVPTCAIILKDSQCC